MGEAAIGWLLLGVALHLANQVTRGRGWCAIVRAASGPDCGPRRRDAIASWVAGAGAGGLVSARGGDALRVLLLKRRMPEAGCPLLAGTLVAEGAGECAAGALLLAIALAAGVGRACGADGGGAPLRARAQGRGRRRARLRAAALSRRLRPRRAAVAAREPRLPARRAGVLPRRLRAPRDVRGGAARRLRSGR